MPDDISARLARLEAVAAIEAVKHRYFRACDAKDPAAFRSCFVATGSALDYGDLGRTDADGMAAVFAKIAPERDPQDGRHVILDMHHGVHPDITVLDADHATGSWTLRFRQVDLTQGVERVLSGEYADEYRREDGAWKIATCTFRAQWSITRPLGDDVVVHEQADQANSA
ncbi:nuclear transport factor 2 family protein [Pimelobacter simplex]|uniref:nuclear transport factor 2 family protein n=1 Tax=Nocardioides simplex TaxID=2045 RepID=UPI003AAB136B